MNDRADGDGVVAVGVGDYQRGLGDSADAHDGRIRLVDDGQAEHGSELAGVGDGEGRAFHVFGLQLFAAGALAEVGDAALQSEEIHLVGVLEDGNDQSPVERDRNADVYVAVVADALLLTLAFKRRSYDGKLLQRDDGGANEERHERKAGAVALLESGFQFVAQGDDFGDVHFEHAVNVGAGAPRFDHALRDDPAHVGEGNEVSGN